MNKKKIPPKKGKIVYTLQAINVVPLLIFGIIIILIGPNWFKQTMYSEIEVELKNVATSVDLLLNTAFPGDYHIEGETALRLYKGDFDITEQYSIIDKIKAATSLEVTVFYKDTRILTTIIDRDYSRIIGSGAPNKIIHEVFETGTPKFYSNSYINQISYFSYYMPIYNSDGSVTGMIFVGKPSDEVNARIESSIYPLLIPYILVIIITAICISIYTKTILSALSKIHSFFAGVSSGNLNIELDKSVISRPDELGDIGRAAVDMQKSIRSMVETDTLTKLYNRRSAERKLKQIIKKSKANQTPFCVCIGDIDFFKKVNDTYGHDAGDVVLETVSDKLRNHMNKYGFVARWGGEEFLFVFDHTDLSQSVEVLENLLSDIRATKIKYNEQTINVTMTFGITSGDSDDINQLIKVADEKLYNGKTNGRNRIIN